MTAWLSPAKISPVCIYLPEALCLKGALCWVFMLAFLYSSHLPMTAGPARDISNITATMTTLTPAAFISAALFLCQCEIPFEFQMEHKQPIIWVQRIVYFSHPSMTELLCAEAILSASYESPVFFFSLSKPSASDPMGLPLQMANVSSHVKHS